MKKKVISILLVVIMSSLFSISVIGAQGTESNITTDQDKVTKMISQYESLKKMKNENIDVRFTNDMVEKQTKIQSEIKNKIEDAKNRGEKLYTFHEIVKADEEEFGISKDDFDKIKKSILQTIAENKALKREFEAAGQGDHPVIKNIIENEQIKLPASLIYIDRSLDKLNGQISGGGWPYCLDDNGWGPYNFITSDCYKAIVAFLICAADSTLGKMDDNLRFCKANVRNCSPLIFHSVNWHEHEWWEQIP